MLSMGDLSINVGETDGLDLNMDNEDAVAGFQFSLISSADVGEIVDVITTERTEGFTCSTANNIVICFSLTGAVIEPGSGAFIVVEVLGTSGGTAEVCYDDVVLSNPDGVAMPNQTSCGSVAVTDEPVESVLMSVGSGSADVGDNGNVDVSMDNSSDVGGFQFYLNIDPAIASIESAETTDRTEGFNVSTANGIVLLFSLTGDAIVPGTGPVVSLALSGDAEGDASLSLENLVVSDPYGNPMPTETSSGSFTVEDGGVEGCMDDTACNYNPEATVEGECSYATVLVTVVVVL